MWTRGSTSELRNSGHAEGTREQWECQGRRGLAFQLVPGSWRRPFSSNSYSKTPNSFFFFLVEGGGCCV